MLKKAGVKKYLKGRFCYDLNLSRIFSNKISFGVACKNHGNYIFQILQTVLPKL
jgi:hypothetical protein